MKTPLSLLLCSVTLVFLSGCQLAGLHLGATPFAPPADLAGLRLERVESASVTLPKVWLERHDGRLAVVGSVLRRFDAPDTTHTTLKVDLLDAAGHLLRELDGTFAPRRLERHGSHPALGIYRIGLDPLPDGVAAIQVRAKEGGP